MELNDPRSTRCSTRAPDHRRAKRNAIWAADRPEGHGVGARSCRSCTRSRCCTARQSLTNVFVNPAYGDVRLQATRQAVVASAQPFPLVQKAGEGRAGARGRRRRAPGAEPPSGHLHRPALSAPCSCWSSSAWSPSRSSSSCRGSPGRPPTRSRCATSARARPPRPSRRPRSASASTTRCRSSTAASQGRSSPGRLQLRPGAGTARRPASATPSATTSRSGRRSSTALPVTLSLAVGAAVLWLVVGVAIGVLSALRRGTLFDRAAMAVALAGVSLPIYFTGLVSLSLFAYNWDCAPTACTTSPFTDEPGRRGPTT